MPCKQRVLVFIICALVASLNADIRLVPGTEPIPQMFGEATLVCRCSVVSVKVLHQEEIPGTPNSTTRNTMIALLKEDRVYKAENKGNQNITVIYEEYPLSPDIALHDGESNLLFFLKENESGTEYTFVEPREVFRMPPVPATEGTAQDIGQLEADLIAGLQTSDHNSRLNALRLLQTLDKISSASISALKQLLAGGDPEISLAVHAVLLKTGDPEEIARFATFEEKNRKGDFLRFIAIGSTLNRVRNPEALPSLARLSNSPTIPIKLGALQAIRSIRDTKGIPTLIAHLDDSDATVRYTCVTALSEITGKSDAPFMGLFHENEAKYINLWKAWWQQEGHALYGDDQR